jgi:hypothetical protein
MLGMACDTALTVHLCSTSSLANMPLQQCFTGVQTIFLLGVSALWRQLFDHVLILVRPEEVQGRLLNSFA